MYMPSLMGRICVGPLGSYLAAPSWLPLDSHEPGPCGPSWALVGAPAPVWDGPLWAHLGPFGPSPSDHPGLGMQQLWFWRLENMVLTTC